MSQVVADQVGLLRKRRDMTQQELAEKIGETQSTVARIEGGKRTITVDDLFRLALALDVAPVHLLGASFGGGKVPAGSLRLEPAHARAWIRGKTAVRGIDPRRFLFENIPDDEVEELLSAKRIRDNLETRLSLVELVITGKAEAVDFDPLEEKARIEGLLAMLERDDGE